jgi:hypothetical protein
MKTTYLLPCQCGESLQVDASESGLAKQCPCGATLKVPTLRGLARLEKVVVEEPASSAGSWGGPQRGIAIGALIALVGIGAGIYWTLKPLPRPQDVFSFEELAKLHIDPNDGKPTSTPFETLLLWQAVEDDGLWAPPPKMLEGYHRAREVVVWWQVASFALGGIGLVVLGAALVARRMRRSRSQAQQPAAAAP